MGSEDWKVFVTAVQAVSMDVRKFIKDMKISEYNAKIEDIFKGLP